MKKTQEMAGGPRGTELDQSGRWPGSTGARKARGNAARSTAKSSRMRSATQAQGKAATAHKAQQSNGQLESSWLGGCSMGAACPGDTMAACAAMSMGIAMSIDMACDEDRAPAGALSSVREIEGPKATPHTANKASQMSDLSRARNEFTAELWPAGPRRIG